MNFEGYRTFVLTFQALKSKKFEVIFFINNPWLNIIFTSCFTNSIGKEPDQNSEWSQKLNEVRKFLCDSLPLEKAAELFELYSCHVNGRRGLKSDCIGQLGYGVSNLLGQNYLGFIFLLSLQGNCCILWIDITPGTSNWWIFSFQCQLSMSKIIFDI